MRRYITRDDVRGLFPDRPRDSHKGNYGYVALIGGSMEYSGAIRLAAMANSAMRSGAGVASVAAPSGICHVIAGQILEATIIPLSDRNGGLVFREEEFRAIAGRYDVIAIGMGIGNTEETARAVRYLLENYDKTLIIDADGLNAMASLERDVISGSGASLVLTPHLKEFSRLSGMSIADIRKDPEASARSLAEELDAVVLLKGSTTYVCDSERTFICDRGCPGMATAGSGDVLSGILSAILVNAGDLTLAAAAGAYINGAAGELAAEERSEVTMTASDTALNVARVIEGILVDI